MDRVGAVVSTFGRISGYSEKGLGPALQRKRNDIKKYR
jgi:hypothetical protein